MNGGGMRRIRKCPKKLRGCIAAPPRLPVQILEEAYLFFLAFFFAAILFSSELREFLASMAGGARIHHHV
jgi:hypothetical protein